MKIHQVGGQKSWGFRHVLTVAELFWSGRVLALSARCDKEVKKETQGMVFAG